MSDSGTKISLNEIFLKTTKQKNRKKTKNKHRYTDRNLFTSNKIMKIKRFSFIQDVSWFETNLHLGWERFCSH